MLIQILVTILAIFVLGRVIFRFRKAALGRAELVLWSLFWIVVIVLVWNPGATNFIAGFLGVGRGADAVFYISIMILFYMIFRLYGKMENIEHRLSELVKKIALRDIDDRK